MKRKALIVTAVVALIGIGTAAAVHAHGPGWGRGYGHGMGYGPGMGYGMSNFGGPGTCPRFGGQILDKPLTPDDVKAQFEQRLTWKGNPNLKVGPVTEKDDKTIVVDIVTKDNSLVRRVEVDKTTGRHFPLR